MLCIVFAIVDCFSMALKKIKPNLFVPFFLVAQIGSAAVSADIPVALGIGLGSSRHIWNTMFAAFLLREPVVSTHVVAVFVIFAGIAVCSVFAFKPPEGEVEVWNADKIFGLYLQKEFFALHAVNLALTAWSVAKIKSGNLLGKASSERSDAIPLIMMSNIFSGYSVQSTRALAGQLGHVFSNVLVATAEGGAFTKLTQPWALPYSDLRELGCVVFVFAFLLPPAIASLWFLDRALALYPALFVTTGTQCIAGVWMLVNGMILFREWEFYTAAMFGGTIAGLALQLLGVYMNYVASQRLEEEAEAKKEKAKKAE